VTLDDFRAYMPQAGFIFMPTGELWPASSVNARIAPIPAGNKGTVKASEWLAKNRPVEQMTWAPGEPQLIKGRLISAGGWIERPGCTVFNLYRPPVPMPGDADLAGPWLDHVRFVYPDDWEHIIRWLAHRVQRPGEKINHAILLGGGQGIGKDTLLEPVKAAVGPWNFTEVSPASLLLRFNGYVKSVILRVSEARDLGDMNRYDFYEHMKVYTASPPDVIRVDEKHIREYEVFNCCGVIITSNHKTDGIYLPADDRRHYVAWSPRTRDDFDEGYWNELYGWYRRGGGGHVAEYLRNLDLSRFDPKAPPTQTQAFRDIVDAGRAPEDAELADVLERLQWPEATTLEEIAQTAAENGARGFAEWLRDRRNSRHLAYRMEAAGYVRVPNDAQKDGRWKVSRRNVAIYARQALTPAEQLRAARDLAEGSRRCS